MVVLNFEQTTLPGRLCARPRRIQENLILAYPQPLDLQGIVSAVDVVLDRIDRELPPNVAHQMVVGVVRTLTLQAARAAVRFRQFDPTGDGTDVLNFMFECARDSIAQLKARGEWL
jgi:hypothetical protein